MTVWALVVFLLGLIAVLINIFDVFTWFIPWWATILMVSAFGMLTRILNKERAREKEKLAERIKELDALLKF